MLLSEPTLLFRSFLHPLSTPSLAWQGPMRWAAAVRPSWPLVRQPPTIVPLSRTTSINSGLQTMLPDTHHRRLAIAETRRIYGRNKRLTRPLTGSLWLKREGARTQAKNQKRPPSPLAAIFRGGRPPYEPTPKNGDRRRRRERQAGRRPSGPPLALAPAMKDRQRGVDRAGREQRRRLPRKAK